MSKDDWRKLVVEVESARERALVRRLSPSRNPTLPTIESFTLSLKDGRPQSVGGLAAEGLELPPGEPAEPTRVSTTCQYD